ncbi:MAG: hypothetical protein WC236_03975 [Gallionellaceae bacterium]
MYAFDFIQYFILAGAVACPAKSPGKFYAALRVWRLCEQLLAVAARQIFFILLPALFFFCVVALLVQIVELLCTSGLPALYTRILTMQQLSPLSYYGYLALYDLAYMLDDVIVLSIGVYTLSQCRLQEKEGRWLKLISGVVMVGPGVYLLLYTH